MSSLEAHVTSDPDGPSRVKLTGAIDENADLAGIFASLEGDTVFDMTGVERINSIGVLRWIDEITPFSKKHRVTVENCSYPVVLQANIVANFFGSATIVSCVAPYFCPSCRSPRDFAVKADEISTIDQGAPARTCPSCASEMEFDELDSYFALLASDGP